MKKLLGIVVLGLLCCNVGFAKEFKIYHKDENNISIERGWTRSKQHVIAAKHCAQYKKFAFMFQGSYNYGAVDEKGNHTYLYHCSKKKLSKSPISGKKIHWTNYDQFHEFAKKTEATKKEEIEQYKTTCTSLGFELGTDKFADCTLKLMLNDKKNTQTSNQTTQSQTQNKIDWGKVAGEFNPKYKQNNKRVCTSRKTTAWEYNQGKGERIITCTDQ